MGRPKADAKVVKVCLLKSKETILDTIALFDVNVLANEEDVSIEAKIKQHLLHNQHIKPLDNLELFRSSKGKKLVPLTDVAHNIGKGKIYVLVHKSGQADDKVNPKKADVELSETRHLCQKSPGPSSDNSTRTGVKLNKILSHAQDAIDHLKTFVSNNEASINYLDIIEEILSLTKQIVLENCCDVQSCITKSYDKVKQLSNKAKSGLLQSPALTAVLISSNVAVNSNHRNNDNNRLILPRTSTSISNSTKVTYSQRDEVHVPVNLSLDPSTMTNTKKVQQNNPLQVKNQYVIRDSASMTCPVTLDMTGAAQALVDMSNGIGQVTKSPQASCGTPDALTSRGLPPGHVSNVTPVHVSRSVLPAQANNDMPPVNRSQVPTTKASSGTSPAIANSGMQPPKASSGMSPTIANSGILPPKASSGMSPTIANSGMLPPKASSGMSPAKANSGILPSKANNDQPVPLTKDHRVLPPAKANSEVLPSPSYDGGNILPPVHDPPPLIRISDAIPGYADVINSPDIKHLPVKLNAAASPCPINCKRPMSDKCSWGQNWPWHVPSSVCCERQKGKDNMQECNMEIKEEPPDSCKTDNSHSLLPRAPAVNQSLKLLPMKGKITNSNYISAEKRSRPY